MLQGKPFIVVCGKTSWWRTDWLREWVAKEQRSREATVGLLFCIVGLEGDISGEIEEAMKDDGNLPITYLGVWSHLVSMALFHMLHQFSVHARTATPPFCIAPRMKYNTVLHMYMNEHPSCACLSLNLA